MDTIDFLAQRLSACGIPHDVRLCEQLLVYHRMLMDWNTRMDLTAVTEEDEMIDRHLVDSLIALTIPELMPSQGSVIDVGTGAGLPGLPLALALPDVQFTLLDAQQKRLDFLAAVIDALSLKNVTLIHARAEDAGRNPAIREKYDRAVARAVAPLAVLAEYLLPCVRFGGKAVCWKGPALTDELTQGRRAAHLLGAHAEEPIPVQIPGRDWAHVLMPLTKVSSTPKVYPRRAGTPSSKPLG